METLIAIITIIQRTGGKRLLLRLFSRLVVVLGLVIITAMMIGAMLIGGLINTHIALLNNGMSTTNILLIIGAATILIIASLIAVIIWQIRKLNHSPNTSQLMDTLNAFTKGLMSD